MQPSWRALPSSLRFYAYDDPALDHGWLLDCAAQLHVPIGKHPLSWAPCEAFDGELLDSRAQQEAEVAICTNSNAPRSRCIPEFRHDVLMQRRTR